MVRLGHGALPENPWKLCSCMDNVLQMQMPLPSQGRCGLVPVSECHAPQDYTGTPSMMLNGAWVGMMRTSVNPAASRSTRYSASVRSSAP